MSEDHSSSLPISYRGSSTEESEPDYWKNHLQQWRQSGLNQAEYCRRHNLKYSRFYKWKDRLCNYYPPDSWDGKTKATSIKLVELKRDFTLNMKTPSVENGRACGPGGAYSIPYPPSSGAGSKPSGIRFWCGAFCVEIDVHFSPETLSTLIRMLQGVGFQRNTESGGSV
jgi:hypothetical protein